MLALPLLLAFQSASLSTPAVARKTFADLLKIPIDPPVVKVEIRNTREEGGLIIEDIVWTSLDNERPVAYLIRPAKAAGPLPAIVCLHGSSGSRESETTVAFGPGEWTRPGQTVPHQRMLGWARELARRGFITLSLTQRGLDTRTPYTNDQAKDLLVRGRTLMGAIVHEIRQSVTYLQSRGEVDPKKIGMTGMSFGGITSFYTWLVDDRIAAVAPICGGVGSVDILLKKGRPSYHGFYWWIPNMLGIGDHGAFAAAQAPRPLLLWAPTEDIGMPAEGVARFKAIAGASESIEIHTPPGVHEFGMPAFLAIEKFFRKWLMR